MFNKRGDMIFADIFSVIFTILLLVGFAMYFLAPDFISGSQGETIIVKESIYGNDNFFVIKSFLNTPYEKGKVSDLINSWLLDTQKEAPIYEIASETLDKTYGKCYQMSFAGHLFLGQSSMTSEKVCIDYPNYNNAPISICLDISEYEEKMNNGRTEECF